MPEQLTMWHWFGNQTCVIDCETTGLDPNWHEIIQICILPLNSNLEPRRGIIPFYIEIKPEHPDRFEKSAFSVNMLSLEKITQRGFDKEKAKLLLQEWMSKLELRLSPAGVLSKIRPLGHNYAFDMAFIKQWLGVETYFECFDYHYVDTMIAAQFLNDKAIMHAEKQLFDKVSLVYVAKKLNIPYEKAHDALNDCLVTAQVYKKLCLQGLFG